MEIKMSDIPYCNDESSDVILKRSSINMCTPMYAYCGKKDLELAKHGSITIGDGTNYGNFIKFPGDCKWYFQRMHTLFACIALI